MNKPRLDVDTVPLSKNELIILANAINEAREALEEWEFSTRAGASIVDADALHDRLSTLLSAMR